MLVRNYMTKHPVMIEPDKNVVEAQQLMVEIGVRHLPVVGDGKKLLGLVTHSRLQIPPERLGSLNMWEITRYLTNLTVEKVMIKGPNLHTLHPNATIEEAASVLIKHKITGLVVVEDGMVMGVISETDLLVELRELLGANDPGWRVTVRMPGRRGESLRLLRPMIEKEWNIMATGSVRSPKMDGYWDMVVKVQGPTEEELVALIDEIGEQELLDIRKTLNA